MPLCFLSRLASILIFYRKDYIRTIYFWGINKAFLYSYEDLEQTIWYILMVGLQEFDGRGDEEQFLNWYIRNKVVSIMMYGKKPPNVRTYRLHPFDSTTCPQMSLRRLMNYSIQMVRMSK